MDFKRTLKMSEGEDRGRVGDANMDFKRTLKMSLGEDRARVGEENE